jgi:hypothetical protein
MTLIRTKNTTIFPSLVLISALTLIVFPMGVFAQGEASVGITEVSDLVSEVELPVDELVIPSTEVTANAYVDTYARETLPGQDVVGDFVVGPGKFELELAPGESKTVEVIVSNRMGQRELFEFQTEDAEGSADGSAAVNLLGERVGPYSIKDFITVPYKKFYLEHGQRVRIPVTVTIPADAEPGAWYGSLLTLITSDPNLDDPTSGAKPGTAIISRIGTLFFVTSPGDIDREGAMVDFSTISGNKVFLQGPIDFGVTFENTGSVHLSPYGRITITNLIGESVGTVDMQPWFVLPKSLRTKELSWNRDLLIGRYTATVQLNRGYDDIVDELSFTFWVFPWKIAAVTFAGIFVFFLLLRFLFTRFEFKRKS